MKDKLGNKLTREEYMKRWKQGVQAITPLQQSKISLMGSSFVTVGICFGFYATILTKTWWLLTILIGSFFVTSVAFLGNIQKYLALKQIDDLLKGGMNDEKQESTN